MQKIKKGLQEKLNIISKIKNNLKIKKYQLKKHNDKSSLQLPNIDKMQFNHQKQNNLINQGQIKNPENQILTWINIKKIGQNSDQLNYLTPNLSARKGNTSFDDKILLTSTYTSRFASKNSLMKLVQFKSLIKDKSKSNFSAEMLRKTFLQKTSRTFSPEKLDKKLPRRNSPQNNLSFYGKINEINHISGTRFKTLDPRFGGLTRQELKQKIKHRQTMQTNFSTISPSQSQSPRMIESLNMYDIETTFNTEKQRRSSIQRYNFITYQNNNNNREQQRGNRKKKELRSKDRYSPWNQHSQQVVWDELPKIK